MTLSRLLFLFSIAALGCVLGDTEFGRTLAFRTNPRIARKRTYFAKGLSLNVEDHVLSRSLTTSKTSSFANREPDHWLLEWSLAQSLSFSFNHASPTHHPTKVVPITTPQTISPTAPLIFIYTLPPAAAPTATSNSSVGVNATTAPSCVPKGLPSTFRNGNLKPLSIGCLQSLSDAPSLEPSHHPSHPHSHPFAPPPRPNPTQTLTTMVPTAGLIPIGIPKTTSPTSVRGPYNHRPPTSTAKGTSTPTQSSSIVGLVDTSSNTAIFECTKHGIVSVFSNSTTNNTTNATSTTVQISVTYIVQSRNGTAFLNELPSSLLQTAVNASLDCHASGRRLDENMGVNRHLALSTTILGRCTPTVKSASCYIVQTSLTYILNQSVDAEYSAYVAYLAIRSGMDQGTYVTEDPSLLQLKYLSPSPMFPTPSGTSSSYKSSATSTLSHETSISSWTMGACITVSAGGLLALVVWGRNRWTRHRRHIQLLEEDISLASPQHVIPDDDKL